MAAKRAEEGAWIFLSHSTKDFLKVSSLRNKLKDQGHRPLMFFLKCLDDDCELDDLIKREIRARTWFILCQSKNSQASRWVHSEVTYVKSLPGKVYEEVDLEKPLTEQLKAAEPLLRRASVFISYAAADRETASVLEQALRASDFGVFSDLDLSLYAPASPQRFEEAVSRGFLVMLISRAFIRSAFGQWDAHTALTWAGESGRRANVVPVYVGVSRDEMWRHASPQFRQIANRVGGFEVWEPERPESFLSLVENLKERPML